MHSSLKYILILLQIGNTYTLHDLFEDPKFDVRIAEGFIIESSLNKYLEVDKGLPGVGETEGSSLSSKRLLIRDNKQDQFLCDVISPPKKERTTQKDNKDLKEQSEDSRVQNKQLGLSLIKKEEGRCITTRASWWTYKFCYNGEIIQYHEPTSEEERKNPKLNQEFVLGRYKYSMPVKEVSENKELVPHESKKDSGNELAIIRFEKEKNVLVEKWGGGDICDLTKKPRTVEVIYECYPQYIEGIIDLKELSTCNYQMIINSVKLCDNPFYTEKKRYITYPINCVEVVKEEDLSRKQKEAEDKKKRQELKLQELEDKAKNSKIIQLDTNKFESLNTLFNNKKGDSVLNLLTELSRLYGSKENKLENKIKDKENSNNEDEEIELDLSKFFGFNREGEEDGDNQILDQDQIKKLLSYDLKETMELLKQEARKNKEESESDEE